MTEDFRITGPGEYVQRDGRVAKVIKRRMSVKYPWLGRDADLHLEGWTDDGRRLFNGGTSPRDLVARHEPKPAAVEPEPESTPTLRDQFAMHIAAGWVANNWIAYPKDAELHDSDARRIWALTDALLRARDER